MHEKRKAGMTVLLFALLIMSLYSPYINGNTVPPSPSSYGTEPPVVMHTNGDVIDAYFLDSNDIHIDGILNESSWNSSLVETIVGQDFNGYHLIISAFHNKSYIFVGVKLWGDTKINANDYCELSFDRNHDGGTAPQKDDVKIRIANTGSGNDVLNYSVGNGSGWEDISVPPGWSGSARVNDNATYEFQIPIADVFGGNPPSVETIGFSVHAYDSQGQHVWWPDHGDQNDPPIVDYSSIPDEFGDLKFHRAVIKTLYLFDDGPIGDDKDVFDVLNTTYPTASTLDDFDGDGNPGLTLKSGWPSSGYNYINTSEYQYWNLTPALSHPLNIQNVNLTLWVRKGGGNPNMELVVELIDNHLKNNSYPNYNVFARKNISKAWSSAWTPLSIDIPLLNGSYTVPERNKTLLLLYRNDTSATDMYIAYNTTAYPSHINITTDTYINIDWVRTYNSTNETDTFFLGENVLIKANVSDPFGSYDIEGAMINITGPNGTVVPTQNMSLNMTDPSNPSGWKLFDFNYTPSQEGGYRVNVSAMESNGVVTNYTWWFTVNPAYQPDLIMDGNGDDEYQSAPQGDQNSTKYINAGQNATWSIKLQNDGSRPDTINLSARFLMLPGWNWSLVDNSTGKDVFWNERCLVVDNGDSGYSESGVWLTGNSGSAYNGNYRYNQSWTSGNTATWSFNTNYSGLYEVFAWWPLSNGSFATNAPYTINFKGGGRYILPPIGGYISGIADSDGSDGTVTINIDQNNTSYGGQWNSLGFYEFDSGIFSINLTDSGADNTIIADAVRLVLVDGSVNRSYGMNSGDVMNYTLIIESPSKALMGDKSWVSLTAVSQNDTGKRDATNSTAEIMTLIPDHLEYVSGDDQSGTVNSTLNRRIEMRVVNESGVPVPGVDVNFTIYSVPSGASDYYFVDSGNPWYIATSNATGIVSALLHLGTKVGIYWVNASNSSLPGNNGPTYNNTLNATAVPGPAAYIDLTPNGGSVNPGQAFNVNVTLYDKYGNIATGYNGTVNFTSTDSQAVLPSNYTFTSSDMGRHQFTVTLNTSGNQWVNVSDVANSSLSDGDIWSVSSQPSKPSVDRIYVYPDSYTEVSADIAQITIIARAYNTSTGTYLSDVEIIWNVSDFDSIPNRGSASLSSQKSVTDSDGNATVILYTGTHAGDNWKVSASNSSVMNWSGEIRVVSGSPYRMEYVSGNGQNGTVGHALSEPFSVRVVDSYGNNVSGVEVSWVVDGYPQNATGFSLNPSVSVTNSSGIAISTLTLGNKVGRYHVNATNSSLDLQGEPVSFHADALPGPAYDISIVSGNWQNHTVASELPSPMVVRVTDSYGNPVKGEKVWFNISTTNLNGDAYISSENPAITDDEGIASARLYLDSAPGENKVRAEISSGKYVVFSENGTAPDFTATKYCGDSIVKPGQRISFILTFENIGTEEARYLWVNESFDPYLEYVSDSSGVVPTINGRNFSWKFQNVGIGTHGFSINMTVLESAGNGTEIHNSFHIDYTDALGRKYGGMESNDAVLTVEVSVETQPPTIEGVPDLVVHYDYDYSFDLTPYVSDPDTPLSELVISTSDPQHIRINSTNNLGIILNYPESMNGDSVPVTIWVSDGISSDYDEITVRITGDFPPEIKHHLPDVSFLEDTVYYGFNISQYFYDRDGDALYYSTGEVHTIVDILPNYTVRFSAITNWSGMERVTFRATDPTHALVEETITVTVIPVNDAPYIMPIPVQRGVVGGEWGLDTTPYLVDSDDSLDNLTISVDDPHVNVRGKLLVFEYDYPVNKTITLTVSDGKLTYSRTVTVEVSAGQSPYIEGGTWWWPWILLLLLIPLIALAYAKKTIIEEIFLVYEDGSLIAHETRRLRPGVDEEILSSMLTAIQDFVKDSFKDEGDWSLKKLEFGDKNILVERGKHIYIAAIYSGKGGNAILNRMRKTIEKIDEKYGDVLENWDGDLEKLRGTKDMLKEIF